MQCTRTAWQSRAYHNEVLKYTRFDQIEEIALLEKKAWVKQNWAVKPIIVNPRQNERQQERGWINQNPREARIVRKKVDQRIKLLERKKFKTQKINLERIGLHDGF